MGDAADGFPGIPGWGAKSAAAVLARFGHLEAIPDDPAELGFRRRGRPASWRACGRAATTRALFLRLATLRLDVPIEQEVADLEWRGVRPGFAELCAELGDEAAACARRVERKATAMET